MAKKKEIDDNELLKEVAAYVKKTGKKLPKGWKIENGVPVYYEPEDYLKGSKKK